MNIVLVGVCDKPESTNTFMAAAFTKLGHNVIKYNYRNVLAACNNNSQDLETEFIYTLENIVKYKEIGLIIFCKTDSLPVTAHVRASELAKTFYWFMDPITTALAMNAKERALACNYASATSLEVIDCFLNAGQPNSYKINEGVDIEMYKPSNIEKTTDVLFVGSPTTERTIGISYLINSGVNLKLFGDSWGSKFGAGHPIFNADLVSEIRRAKIVLNISRTNSYSDRVALSMAAGAFVLTTDVPEIHKDFKVGHHLEAFSSYEDLYERVSFYLVEEKLRERIAKSGTEWIRETRSWELICKKILGITND